MAPHRANIQEHRLVFGLCASESGVAPLIPVDGLVRSGTQVGAGGVRSEEHTSELQSHLNLVCRLLLEKKKKNKIRYATEECCYNIRERLRYKQIMIARAEQH